MHPLSLVLPLLATIALSACGGKETRPDAPPATSAASTAAAAPVVTPAPAKPACDPAAKPALAKASKKSVKGKTATATEAANGCPPPASETSARVVASSPGAAASKEPVSNGKACNPCNVKSKDGSFDGEIYGTIPASSKWAKLQIGMHQSEVERIIGVSRNVRAYVTGKAFIPFYFGSDSHRYEVVYPGQGSVAYTGGSFGGGMGVLMMINFDAKIQ